MGVGSISGLGRRAGSSKLVERLGRTGLVAKGVLYGVVAILALQVALGARGEDPDKDGALRAIAQQPFEKVLLAVLAVLALGLAGYAVWRLARASSTATTRAKVPRASQTRRRNRARRLVRSALRARRLEARRGRERLQQRQRGSGRYRHV